MGRPEGALATREQIEYGGVDILVNNAGIPPDVGFDQLPRARHEMVLHPDADSGTETWECPPAVG